MHAVSKALVGRDHVIAPLERSQGDDDSFRGTDLFVQQSPCMFARQAKIWRHPYPWNAQESISTNVENLRPALDAFMKHTRHAAERREQAYDVFPIEAPASLYAQDFRQFSAWVGQVLRTISPHSVAQLDGLKPHVDGYYADDGWLYNYQNVPTFVVSSCHLYPLESSRYSGGSSQERAIIHLQPLQTVEHKLGATGDIQKRRRDANVRHFVATGCSYYEDQHLVMGSAFGAKYTHEAPRFVKPLETGASPVAWWRETFDESKKRNEVAPQSWAGSWTRANLRLRSAYTAFMPRGLQWTGEPQVDSISRA